MGHPDDPSRTGPETKCGSKVSDDLLRHVRAGNYLETAAHLVGIDRTTLFQWMKKGRQGVEPYRAFLRDVNQAIAESEESILTELGDLSKDPKTIEEKKLRAKVLTWRAERRFGQKWGRTITRVEYDEDGGADDEAKILDRLLGDKEARQLLIDASHRGAALEGDAGGDGDPPE